MHVPYLFCLVFCLRTSKSLSMGEFDKCHICMGILNDLESILGLICIIYCFMHIFLRLCWVLACSDFDCRFMCVEPSVGRRVWSLSQAKSRVSKTSAIGLSQMIQGKNQRNKKEHKTQRSRSVGTTATRVHHELPVVEVARPCYLARTAVRPPLLPICVFPLRLFGLLRGFSIWADFFVDKKRIYLAWNSVEFIV